MPDILLIIAQKGFHQIEYKDTRKELEKAGLSIDVASVTIDTAVGKDGTEVDPDISVKDADLDDYKAVVLIGGPGALDLEKHEEVLNLLKKANIQKKLIAAICISPVILAKAGLLKDKKATVWNGDGEQSEIIKSYGAEFVDEQVVHDNRIITANGPDAAKKFGRKIADVLR